MNLVFPPTSVLEVSMRQARLALDAAGKLDAVNTVIATIPDPALRKRAGIEWEYASVVRRDGPMLKLLQPALGWTDAEIDALFAAAAAID